MAIDRREFLGALALAPAALSGCAPAASAGRGRTGVIPPAGEGARAEAPPEAGVLAAVRRFRLPPDAEPAAVFRAAAARPGEP